MRQEAGRRTATIRDSPSVGPCDQSVHMLPRQRSGLGHSCWEVLADGGPARVPPVMAPAASVPSGWLCPVSSLGTGQEV